VTTQSKIAVLEERKTRLALAFAEATSPGLRRVLEQEVEAVEESIAAMRPADQKSEATEDDEDDVHEFVAYAKKLLEHPKRILQNIGNLREQLALYRLFFDRAPTYEEFLSGTPKLGLTLRILRDETTVSPQMVHHVSLDWNTVSQEVEHWQQAYWAVDAILERMQVKEAHQQVA